VIASFAAGPRRLAAAVALAGLLVLASAGPAAAASIKRSFTAGPFPVAGYSVKLGTTAGIPTPGVDASITAMSADVTDVKTGRQVPINRIMLHHIVFANLGAKGTSGPPVPFYGDGEERAQMQLPPGYGYPITAGDRWAIVWMLMNHKAKPDQVFIHYTITYDVDPGLTPVVPLIFDASHGRQGLVYDVAGGRARGSVDTRTHIRRAPFSGRIVAGLGHVHGGARDLALSQPDCGDRQIYRSSPTWGLPNHPFYKVTPVLHEPGPINMSRFASAQGIPVTAGQQLKLTSRYDAERPHTRVMGLMAVYLARDDSVTNGCAALPTDTVTYRTSTPGRAAAPAITVGLTGLNPFGRAVPIQGPPGAVRRYAGDAAVEVGDFFYRTGNISVPRGATIRWRFDGQEPHNVTIANGPRGFSSDRLRGGGVYEKTLDQPGTYRIFCELHPVQMSQRVIVRSR